MVAGGVHSLCECAGVAVNDNWWEYYREMKGWIGVDLDGTLAYYEKFIAADIIGAPIPKMVERVQRWIAEGKYDVKIFTARISCRNFEERRVVIDAVDKWCVEHIGRVLPVTNVKDWAMVELWDDRAVQVIPNTGEPVGTSTRGLK